MRVAGTSLAGLILAAIVTAAQPLDSGAVQRINLAERLRSGMLKPVNRDVSRLPDRTEGVKVTEREGSGVVWIDGTNFALGTIELDVRGRDVLQRSFLGVAFHRLDDSTYEAVYLRPFNFRAQDPVRRDHAVQYIALPDYDWPRLRKEFPEEFENPVEGSVAPTDWVRLRIVVDAKAIHVSVGSTTSPTLEARRLGRHDQGMIGLWCGNNSDGDFADLRITPAR